MNYTIGDIVTYLKANWKHLLTGGVLWSAVQHYQVPGSAKLAAIAKIFGFGG